MDRSFAAEMARELLDQHARGQIFTSMREQMPTADHAYAVQEAYVAVLLDRTGSGRAGYKIGLTTPRMQAMCGIGEPIAGVVFDTRVMRSPARLSAGRYGRLGLESELCVVLGRDLPADCTRDDVARAAVSIHAAFEVIDDRAADYARLDAMTLVADNSWNEGVVLGAAGDPGVAAAALNGRLWVNGELTDSGSTGDALGHPFDAVVWLARHLARRGGALRAGELVMTGSIVTSKFPKAGQSYRFEIDGLAPAEVTVTA